MKERTGVVTAMGKPITLVGDELQAGDKAPDAIVVDNDMKEVHISSFLGKVLIIASVPSLDTPVCHTETRKFNEKASQLSPDTLILTISMDLPFAQKRWCAAEGVERVQTLSDYRYREFGEKYGVLVKESKLLARTVFVVDKDGIIRYIQFVADMSQEPNYNEILNKAEELARAGVTA